MHHIGQDKPLYCSKMGKKNLAQHIGPNYDFRAVEDGGSLSLGKRSLTFLETRMLHWPDSMFSYCPEDKILFSSDAFGQHYAGPERFDDELGDAVMAHAEKYFANILLLYTPLIERLIKKVTDMGPFRAVRWDVLRSFNMAEPNFGWNVEMQAKAALGGWRVAEVPVGYRRRTCGRSKITGNLRKSLEAGYVIISTIIKIRLLNLRRRPGGITSADNR